MPTTSNFGWTTPADTDLVKDGAAAIRTLGNGIDTSLVDLKGGTTGQILSKNSNTDLDYTWINNDQGDITEVQAGTGISVASGTGPVPVVTNTVATTFDAKGDLVVGTGADTFAKLTVGANGSTLVANSSTSTGLEWQAPAGGGAYTSLASGTLSGSSVSLTSISQSYTDLYLVLRDVNLNTDNYITYRLNNDTTANFHISLTISARIGGGAATIANSTTSIEGTYWYPDSGDANNSYCLRVNDYTTSLKKTGIAQASYKTDNGNEGVIFNGWGYSGTSAVDRIDILTGSTFDGGTYILYGVK